MESLNNFNCSILEIDLNHHPPNNKKMKLPISCCKSYNTCSHLSYNITIAILCVF